MHQIIEGAWIIETDEPPDIAYSIEDECTLVVRLEANATTGYNWSYAISDEEMLVCDGEAYLPDESGEGMVGTGGTYAAKFSPTMKGAGWVAIAFSYACPWETDVKPVETRELNVWINEAGTLSVGEKAE